MHWFWRAAVAVVIATLLGNLFVLEMNIWGGFAFLEKWDVSLGILGSLIYTLVNALPSVFGVGAWVYMSYRFSPERDRETRCRKCGYILRGIPEPRCSECGEKI